MFDWLEINLDRFTQPLVITGLILMVVGLALVLSSQSIANALNNKNKKNYTTIVYVSSTVVLLIGVFITILGVK